MQSQKVYNYLSEYVLPTRKNQYYLHGSSDLKRLSKKIQDMSAEQPLYFIDFHKSSRTYPLSLKASSAALQKNIAELTGDEEPSVFQKTALASSNEDAVTAIISEDSRDVLDAGSLTVWVDSLAAPQQNVGRFISDEERAPFAGQYSFHIQIKDSTYAFQFQIGADAAPEKLQEKLSNFINKTDIGINAAVLHDSTGTRSALFLEAVESGFSQAPHFSAYDVKTPDNVSMGLISYFGLGEITIPAKNTQVRVNDTPYEASGQTVEADGVTLHVKELTEEPVTVYLITAPETALIKIQDFLNSFNHLQKLAYSHEQADSKCRKLTEEIHALCHTYRNELAAVGIKEDTDGQLQPLPEQIKSAVENGAAEAFFTAERGFTKALSQKTELISIDPISYLDKKPVTYPNFNAPILHTPYVTSRYSGLLFSDYC